MRSFSWVAVQRADCTLQMFADVYNTKVFKTNIDQDAGALGAAAIAAVGCGLWKNFDRIDQIHKTVEIMIPDKENNRKYEDFCRSLKWQRSIKPRYGCAARPLSCEGRELRIGIIRSSGVIADRLTHAHKKGRNLLTGTWFLPIISCNNRITRLQLNTPTRLSEFDPFFGIYRKGMDFGCLVFQISPARMTELFSGIG